jgi:hypothetical protein
MDSMNSKRELKRHAILVRQSYELLEGTELRDAIDIAYDAIVKKNGRIDQKQLMKKNNELEMYLAVKAANNITRYA